MNNSRRDFLRNSALAGLALSMPFKNELMAMGGAHNSFGIQLWSVKEALAKDTLGVLKHLSKSGFKKIESFEGEKGIFWGMKNTEFKKRMDALGMKLVSSHCDTSNNFEQKAAEAAEIGMKYLICPYKGAQKSIDDFKKIAAQFNEKGDLCKKYGIRFAYHNHDYSFKSMNGIYPQDILMKETDSNLVDFEMDMYWVVTAGEDPMAWLKRYPNRFHLAHIKDRSRTPINQGQYESVDLGTGSINYPALLKNAKQWGLNYLFMEQEFYPNGSPLLAAETGAGYLKKIKF